MIRILNFSHPLTERQKQQIEDRLGQSIQDVVDIPAQFDLNNDFAPQVRALIDALEIGSASWQGDPWLIVTPSLNYIAAIVLAELHGRMGHFPVILRLRPKADALIQEYELAEIINLEQVRQQARMTR